MKVLIVALDGGSNGSGHRDRCGFLAEKLTANGYEVTLKTIRTPGEILDIPLTGYDAVIKDSRNSEGRIDRHIGELPAIILDDTYQPILRNGFRYYMNAIPAERQWGNLTSIEGLLLRPALSSPATDSKAETPVSDKIKTVFVFGFNDPYQLSPFCAEAIRKFNLSDILDVTMIVPGTMISRYAVSQQFKGMELVPTGTENYSDLVSKADCIVTHYGLLALEAFQKGIQFAVVNPTRYHERLSRRAFPEKTAGTPGDAAGKRLAEILRKIKSELSSGMQPQRKFDTGSDPVKEITAVLDFIEGEIRSGISLKPLCPICGNVRILPVRYSRDATLFFCKSCRSLHRINARRPEINQDSGAYYYTDEYKALYGKTYAEDRPNHSAMNKRRLDILLAAAGEKWRKQGESNGSFHFLDIGCALGFFLEDAVAAGRKAGIQVTPHGVEINRFARETCVGKGIRMAESLEKLRDEGILFSCVSMWYVFEHFADINAVLALISKITDAGAAIALAVPSIFGPTFTWSRKKYLDERPVDHYTDLSPLAMGKLLKKHGFAIERISVPSPHYDRFSKRFPLFSRFIPERLYNRLAVLYSFGDTMEVYAVKD